MKHDNLVGKGEFLSMHTGIYKYENKINKKIYIGQSVNIEKRYRQHLYCAENSIKNKMAIDRAIEKYGIDNFDFSIVEECRVEDLDDREKYWIAYYNSYKTGYNNTIGGLSLKGSDHPRAILNEQQVWEIREMYNSHISRRTVFEKFKDTGLTKRGFLKIWNGENW